MVSTVSQPSRGGSSRLGPACAAVCSGSGAAQVTLETPEGAQDIECADDTYVLDAAEVRYDRYPASLSPLTDRFFFSAEATRGLLRLWQALNKSGIRVAVASD